MSTALETHSEEQEWWDMSSDMCDLKCFSKPKKKKKNKESKKEQAKQMW